ncbi:copper amine oxidase N-terminal domain-containing protein [Paenibacillus cisolokensis]|uniref:copper amine oxidase N-terminal domain-containing protein n=1 Tax=Paenibacillus cisolokensis TaxID=1658519 RepID=UPI003D2B563A
MHPSLSRSARARWLITAGLLMLGMILLSFVNVKASHAALKPIDVFVNDEQVAFSIDPDVKGGTTLVQMRPFFEALGMEVTWSQKDQTVSAVKEGVTILLPLNSTTAKVNGQSVKLDRPAMTVSGHTLVPLRFVSESTGALVHWNGVHREIIVYTYEFVTSFGLTMEEVEKLLKEAQAKVNAEHAAAKEAEKAKPSIVLPPVVQDNGGPVQLNQLRGMYFGGEYDYAGYRCGGVCWLFYTFLPDQKVVVGEPKGGGPETIDCSKDTCRSYSIKDGMLRISGGEPLPIAINKDGELEINEIIMRKVLPMPDGTKLGGEFISQGYTGLVGVTPFTTTWTNYLTFYPDGTFTSDQSSLASLNTGNTSTDVASERDSVRGKYRIDKNTIIFTYADGKVDRFVFAVPPQRDGESFYVQIGNQSFHIEME